MTRSFMEKGEIRSFVAGLAIAAVAAVSYLPSPSMDDQAAMLGSLEPAAGGNASVTMTASAQVLAPIEVTRLESLKFGTIVAVNSPGEITVSPSGRRSISGDVAVSENTPFHSASFLVKGMPNVSYTINLPDSVVANGPSPLEVRDLKSYSENLGSVGTTGKLSASGSDKVSVGGKMIVAENTVPGEYSALFDITVAY